MTGCSANCIYCYKKTEDHDTFCFPWFCTYYQCGAAESCYSPFCCYYYKRSWCIPLVGTGCLERKIREYESGDYDDADVRKFVKDNRLITKEYYENNAFLLFCWVGNCKLIEGEACIHHPREVKYIKDPDIDTKIQSFQLHKNTPMASSVINIVGEYAPSAPERENMT